MFLKGFLLTSIFLLLTVGVHAQITSQKCRYEKLDKGHFVLDSLSVDAASITMEGIPDSLFHYNINTGNIELSQKIVLDSALICYRTLPFKLNEVRFKKSMHLYDSNAIFKDRPPVQLNTKKEELFHSPELNKTGSLSRGISFGNTQNVFVNSALNLQLEGKISDDINIRAVISDQNIPLQPEGNTQQLQEFDKVYIQLYNEHASLTAGDVVLQNKASHFLRYYKNVQGGQLEGKYKTFGSATAETSASVSIAKGKFASVPVEVIEGVLGPYRLRGPENERFIIVLANSEKVFLDGVLLQRGFDHDYVIDYNLGEITFTPKVLVTKYSRLRIDYEYSERNYSRSIMNASHYQKAGKANIYLNLYSEKDNPHQPLSFGLSDEQKLYLSEIGDNLEQAQIPSYDSVAFSNNRVLYKKEIINQNGADITIFKYTAHPDSARFSVVFSEVGYGKGNYESLAATANGRINQYVPPVNGMPQGRFEPVRSIPLPNKRQMITTGAGYDLSEYDKVSAEAAFSDHDLNMYSNLDNDDDRGKAFKVGYQMTGRKLAIKNYKLNSLVDYEFNDENFRPIDRYRYIEFDRDWSYNPMVLEDKTPDHIFNWLTSLEKDFNNRLEYKISARKRGEHINGIQHYVNGAKKLQRFQVSSQNFMMNNHKLLSRSEWYRSFNDIHYTSRFLVPGYEYRLDKNNEKVYETGKLLFTAMNYQEHKGYIKTNDSLDVKLDLNHSFRVDNDTLNNELVPATRAHTTNFGFGGNLKKNQHLNFLMTYRNLEFVRTDEIGNENKKEETAMGRVDWMGNIFDKHIKSELTYAVGNGRELKREFIYLQVPAGEGTHTWRDDNGDNIQDLNEFYEAINPDERNYARIFVPTDEYILAYSGNFNYRLNVEMPRAWRSIGGLKGFLSRFSNNTFWTIEKKITDSNFASRLIPFNTTINEEDLLSMRENFRSTFFYNRADPKFGLEGGMMISEFKQLMTNGFETNQNAEYRIHSRYNIEKTYNIGLQSATALRSSSSDFLEGRNYAIRSYRLSPELAWQPTTHIRLTGSYSFHDKLNILSAENSEKAHFDEYTVDVRLAKASAATFSAVLKYTHIEFEGQANTPLGYALLEALQPGDNLTWSFTLQQKITTGLQMNINYEGRKSGEANMIHIGRMQVNALF
ncbi:MAG: hypothetical protein M3512_05940 [Bacteroidota bacterium]|nr:hypothetical protein [Bacteroidota bacterium]